MKKLHDGCWRSDYSVNPKNWDRAGASCKKPWYIQYWFHDPSFNHDPVLKKGKLIIIKGMNHLHLLPERRDAVRELMAEEDNRLLEERYHPILKKCLPKPVETNYVIHPDTPLIKALELVLPKIECVQSVKDDIRLILNYFKPVAKALGIDKNAVSLTTRAHIRAVLDYHADHRKTWSNNQWNHHRRYLSMMFSELMELEAIGANPVTHIKKKKVIRIERLTLTPKERIDIDNHLRENYPPFHRYVNCFFHLGGRGTELQRVQYEDVNIKAGKVMLIVLKGRQYVKEWRAIKDVAIPFWVEAMKDCQPGQYVFGPVFTPSDRKMNSKQPSKWWLDKVKVKLGIKADIYSLKYLNSDETAALTDLATAAKHNGHKTNVIELYAQGEKERQLERLRKIGNTFA